MANRRRKRKPDSPASPSAPQDSAIHPSEQKTSDKKPSDTDTPASTAAALQSFELPSLSRILSVVMLILGIIAVGALFYKVMAGFFVPLFLAALLVVIFRPIHQWINFRLGNRPRIASLATTLMIMFVVLLPVILLLSVATSQFTAMVSHVNFKDLTAALDRGRDRLGIALPHAEQFRRLDVLTDTFDKPQSAAAEAEPESDANSHMLAGESAHEEVLASITEALTLVRFLQEDVEGPPTADAAASVAEARLEDLRASVIVHGKEASAITDDELIGKLSTEEEFHRQSVIASAAIRSWMRLLLGGTFRSQVRMLANPSAEDFKSLMSRARESLQPRFVTVTSATGTFLLQSLIGLGVLVIAVYFFLLDGASMIRTLMRLSPLDDNYEAQLLLEFDRTSRAVVLASVSSALAQGILATLAFWLLGFDSLIFLFLITSLMALVPFLGAASVWVPCAIYLAMVEQRWSAAIGLAIYGTAIVSSIDNVIKMYVLHGRSTMHPLFALLSVLGGVKVFGPIGILVGPMVVVFLQTLLEILNHELAERDASTINTTQEE